MRRRPGFWWALLLGAGIAAAHAQNPLAIIVAPGASDEPVDAATLALIFERKKLYWSDGRRIQPINLRPEHPLRIAFSRAVLGAEPGALDAYWNEQYFHGIRPPYVVASEAAMLRLIGETQGAIGYADACHLDETVQIVALIDTEGHWHRAHAAPDTCASPP